MAAPEMNARAMIRRNEAVFCTVDGAKLDGSEYASAMLTKTKGRSFLQPGPPFSQFLGAPAWDTVCRRRDGGWLECGLSVVVWL